MQVLDEEAPEGVNDAAAGDDAVLAFLKAARLAKYGPEMEALGVEVRAYPDTRGPAGIPPRPVLVAMEHPWQGPRVAARSDACDAPAKALPDLLDLDERDLTEAGLNKIELRRFGRHREVVAHDLRRAREQGGDGGEAARACRHHALPCSVHVGVLHTYESGAEESEGTALV